MAGRHREAGALQYMLLQSTAWGDTHEAVAEARRQMRMSRAHLPESVQEQEDAVILLQDIAGDGFHGLAGENACHHVH